MTNGARGLSIQLWKGGAFSNSPSPKSPLHVHCQSNLLLWLPLVVIKGGQAFQHDGWCLLCHKRALVVLLEMIWHPWCLTAQTQRPNVIVFDFAGIIPSGYSQWKRSSQSQAHLRLSFLVHATDLTAHKHADRTLAPPLLASEQIRKQEGETYRNENTGQKTAEA